MVQKEILNIVQIKYEILCRKILNTIQKNNNRVQVKDSLRWIPLNSTSKWQFKNRLNEFGCNYVILLVILSLTCLCFDRQTHVNPCFVQSSLTDDPRPLHRDSWHRLHHGDLFSLLPGHMVYRVEAVGGEDARTPRSDTWISFTQRLCEWLNQDGGGCSPLFN